MTARSLVVLAGAAFICACRPALDDRPWLVTAAEIVAVKLTPPEVAPGGAASMEVVALDPGSSPPDASATAWTLCRAPRPLAETRVVGADCLAPSAADAVGNPVAIAVPADACRLFGPDVPQPPPGAPPTRPHDPDSTGGYYQPVVVALEASHAVALERVSCGLPDASLAVARAFAAVTHPNQNPAIASLSFSIDGAAVDPGALAAGARVAVELTWLAGSAESYPVFDRGAGALVDARERLTAAWYVTAGDLDRAAADVDDPTVLSAATTWTAPAVATTAEIVVVLRDGRGGSDVARALLNVR